MRFSDWDVLLFPPVPAGVDPKYRIPFKEFKTTCQVVPDTELAQTHGSPGIPQMTCFIPSLPPGALFNVSIHTWNLPEISHYTRNYSAHPELVRFECRIFIDGRLVSASSFDRMGQWPRLISDTFECTKNGELRPLRFPVFRREVMSQNHWNAADDIGRIKVVISEGFPRDSLSMPIERTRNVVSFSFQHAPLDLLESKGIAWPNPQMWRRPATVVQVPNYYCSGGTELHSHSPRRDVPLQNQIVRNTPRLGVVNNFQPSAASTNAQSFHPSHPYPAQSGIAGAVASGYRTAFASGSGPSYQDPFNMNQGGPTPDWVSAMGGGIVNDTMLINSMWANHNASAFRNTSKQSSLDTSMHDYVSSQGEPMHISGPSLEDDPASMQVPTNTPIVLHELPNEVPDGLPNNLVGNMDNVNGLPVAGYETSNSSAPMSDFDLQLTQALLNQPMPMPIHPQRIAAPAAEIKSKKENRQPGVLNDTTDSAMSTPRANNLQQTRKFSQPTYTTGALGSSVGMQSASNPLVGTPSLDSASQGSFSAGGSRHSSAGVAANMGGENNNLSTAKMVMPLSASSGNVNTPSGAFSTGGGGGTKRSRTFTPASARVIDEEDEPRRPSPRSRAAGGAEE